MGESMTELDEILGAYGIVRKGKKPPFGLVNIESDTLFEHLEALIHKRETEARIEEKCKAIARLTVLLKYGKKSESHLEKILALYESELKALSAKHSSKEDVNE
jgi:hypothetical protein